jgi:hypothetical protein
MFEDFIDMKKKLLKQKLKKLQHPETPKSHEKLSRYSPAQIEAYKNKSILIFTSQQ